MTAVAFVLLSWRPDAPAGMERSVAASAVGLLARGHRALVVTADPDAPDRWAGVPVARLQRIRPPRPCGDVALRALIDRAGQRLTDELAAIYDAYDIDVAVHVDALWGLGRAMPTGRRARSVLAAHVVGHDADVVAALDRRPHAVLVPSPVVTAGAAARGHDTSGWRVVPNALLHDPAAPRPGERDALRADGPVRILARLGPEKGVHRLLADHDARQDRPVEVALAEAGFEDRDGGQAALLAACRAEAARAGATVGDGLPWDAAAGWLAGAAVVIVPSLAETFGLVALEAMAGGTPVVAHDVGNLPALIGDGGVLVPVDEGPAGLWRAARALLAHPVRYGATSRAGYTRSRDYRPAHVADLLLKAVS